eukprot:7153804-Prymnesium_polylepis.1
MLAAEAVARDQQQETAEGEGAEEDNGTKRNEEAAESEEVEEVMDRGAASPVQTLSGKHRSKISDR